VEDMEEDKVINLFVDMVEDLEVDVEADGVNIEAVVGADERVDAVKNSLELICITIFD